MAKKNLDKNPDILIKSKSKTSNVLSNKLKIFHLNINGLRSKYSELVYFLENNEVDVLSLNETKIDNSTNISFTDYNIERNDRTGQGGGVALVINKE